MKPQYKNWSPEKIQGELFHINGNRYGAVTIIARRMGRTTTLVRSCINGTGASEPARRAIAEFIGKPVEAIWPEIYFNGGPRGPGRPRSEDPRKRAVA